VDKKEAKEFFNKNHLMGSGSGNSLGLYYNEELICCMQFRRLRDSEYDISRFCTKLYTSVSGGFSRLLKNFYKMNDISSMRCFIDRRYGQGSHLKELGFEKQNCDISFKWTNGVDIFNRMKFPGNTGYDQGLIKIWDCGQVNYTAF